MATLLPICIFAASIIAGADGRTQTVSISGEVWFGRVPVPGTVVSLARNEQRRGTLSDADGRFQFDSIEVGNWTIKIEMLGFETIEAVVIVSENPTHLRYELALRSVTEIAGLSEFVPETNCVGADCRPAASSSVSLPSVIKPGLGIPGTTPISNDAIFTEQSEATADGLLLSGSVNNGGASPFAQLAAFGNNRRATRSRYNVALGIIYGHSALDARPFSFSQAPGAKPSYTNLRIAGVAGGPLKIPGIINRPNIFVGWQRSDDQQLSTQVGLVPTLRERAGDFSESRDSFGRPFSLIDPQTGRPFVNNAIPADRISPQAAMLLRFYPEPNIAGLTYNHQASVPTALQQDNVEFRVTQAISGRTQVSSHVTYQRATSDTRSVFGFEDGTTTSSLNTGGILMQRLRRSLTLRLRYQLDRSTTQVTPYFAGRTNVSGLAGIVGNNQDATNWGPPTLVFSSGITTLSDALPNSTRRVTNTVGPEILWNRGQHNITLGGAAHVDRTLVVSHQDPRGTLGFTGAVTGSDVADFLLGLPRTSSIAFGNADKYLNAINGELYVVDDFRVSPTLSVNLGARWEYESPMSERFGRLVNLATAPGFTSAVPVVSSNGLLQPDRRGWQPRVGVAWRPIAGSSLVIRGGYGVYRNNGLYKPIAILLSQQPPLSKTFAVETSAAIPLTLANAFLVTPGAQTNTFAVDPNFRVGYAQTWQASMQRDLPASLFISATYMGTKGAHLMREFLPNTYPIGAANACTTCPLGFVFLESNGESLRNALQVELRRRLQGGWTATLQYTISKSTDDAAAFTTPSLSGSAIAQDWRDLDAERAPSAFDQRHLVIAEAEYSTGMGRSGAFLTGWRRTVFNGWTFTGQLKTGSGLPTTPVVIAPVPGVGVLGTIRADLTGAPVSVRNGGYANPTAYAAPIGHWGTAGRNSIRGPAQFGLNASVAREFAVGERTSLEWRVDATNVLNTATYSAINTIVGSPQFGLPTTANTMRRILTTGRVRVRF